MPRSLTKWLPNVKSERSFLANNSSDFACRTLPQNVVCESVFLLVLVYDVLMPLGR